MQTSHIIRPLRSGQITIPAGFRKKLGINEETVLKMTIEGDVLRLVPLSVQEKGTSWVQELYDMFTPVRTEARKRDEKEINETIDTAVKEVRKRYAQGSI